MLIKKICTYTFVTKIPLKKLKFIKENRWDLRRWLFNLTFWREHFVTTEYLNFWNQLLNIFLPNITYFRNKVVTPHDTPPPLHPPTKDIYSLGTLFAFITPLSYNCILYLSIFTKSFTSLFLFAFTFSLTSLMPFFLIFFKWYPSIPHGKRAESFPRSTLYVKCT